MPKKLIADIYTSYAENKGLNSDPATVQNAPPLETQQADELDNATDLTPDEQNELGIV